MGLTVNVKRSKPEAIIPKYEHDGDAGVDLCSCVNHLLTAGERALIPTGLHLSIPSGHEAQVRPRSGLALKHGITVLNTPGTIDAGYRGEISIILMNHSKQDFTIEKGMRIAQMVFAKVEHATFAEAESLDETTRGAGGFGSTGTQRKN